MNESWVILVFAWPMLAAIGVLYHRIRNPVKNALIVTAALPALVTAVTQTSVLCDLPWLMLGAQFGLVPVTRIFLLFTSLLWLIAGWFSITYMKDDPGASRFHFLFLLTLSGNIGLILARDAVSFYALFALMTFAAYGLIVHNRTEEARRAARVYIVMAILGELMILGAIWLIAHEADRMVFSDLPAAIAMSSRADVIIFLVLAGFGVKAGVLLLHMWLPLAHPVAPTPASAVLSGAMIKAGLVAWINFLPAGAMSTPSWSLFCIVAGFLTAFYAAGIGFTQSDPKTILAYSSISQMGVMLTGLGIGLYSADLWQPVVLVLALYALNHGMAKGMLFLGVGVAHNADSSKQRIAVMTGLSIAALSIAGAPFTGGFVSKGMMKDVAGALPNGWATWIGGLLLLSALATSLILFRFLHAVWTEMKHASHPHRERGLWPAWLASALAVVILTWMVAPDSALRQPGLSDLWKSAWPIGLGALLFAGLVRLPLPAIPAGDLVVPLEKIWRALRYTIVNRLIPVISQIRSGKWWTLEALRQQEDRSDILSRWERSMERLERAGSLFVITMILLFVLLWMDI